MSDSKSLSLVDRIKRPVIYGLLHDDQLIYVGQTTQPPRRRLSSIGDRLEAYVRKHDLSPDDLEFRELDYRTEREAIEDLQDDHDLLNVRGGCSDRPSWDGYDWSEEEARLLGTMPDHRLADELGLSWDEVRNARVKAGIPPSHTCSTDWSDWADSPADIASVRLEHAVQGTSCSELAEKWGCSSTSIRSAVRGDSYQDVPFPEDDLDGRDVMDARWLHLRGLKVGAICRRLYATPEAVRGAVEPMYDSKRFFEPDEVMELRLRYELRDVTQKEIAEQEGISYSLVQFVLYSAQSYSAIPELRMRLPDEDIFRVEKLFCMGHLVSAIAEKFLATEHAVHDALHRSALRRRSSEYELTDLLADPE